jgi:hypothetical protein
MPWPYLHAYLAILAVLVAAWHAAAGNLAKAALAGACCVAFGMAATLELSKRPAVRVAVPAGGPWWCYLTPAERAWLWGAAVAWGVAWAGFWFAMASS